MAAKVAAWMGKSTLTPRASSAWRVPVDSAKPPSALDPSGAVSSAATEAASCASTERVRGRAVTEALGASSGATTLAFLAFLGAAGSPASAARFLLFLAFFSDGGASSPSAALRFFFFFSALGGVVSSAAAAAAFFAFFAALRSAFALAASAAAASKGFSIVFL